MKKTIPSFFTFAGVVLIIIVLILFGKLISLNRDQFNPTITPSPFSSTSTAATSTLSTLTPVLSVTKIDRWSDQNQSIFLVLAIAVSVIGILYLIRIMYVASRGFASLSENLKRLEEKQNASLQSGRSYQQEIIQGLSLIKDANNQALNDNISTLRNGITEDVRRLEEIQSNNLQIGRSLQLGNKEIINGLSLIIQEKTEKTQSATADSSDQVLNNNISNLPDEISELKSQALVSQAPQSKTGDASDPVLNNNISMLRDEISELKRQPLVTQTLLLPEDFMSQLSGIIRKFFKEYLRIDIDSDTPPDVLKSKSVVGVYERELDRMKEMVLEYPNIETGGDLFGFWTHSGAPVIQFVLGPGPKSTHMVTSFYQDVNFLRTNGEYLNRRHGFQHIGEWHSHHTMSLNHPSGGDEATIHSALSNYGFQRFLLCIANIERDGNVSFQPYLFEAGRSTYKAAKWNIFSGESPFRSLEVEMSGSNIDNKKPSRNKQIDYSIESNQVKSVSPQAWYATNEGRIFLKDLESLLKESFDECKMKLRNSGQLYFLVKNNKFRWQLQFPDDFPGSNPSVIVGEKTHGISLKSGIKPDKLARWVYDQFMKVIQEEGL